MTNNENIKEIAGALGKRGQAKLQKNKGLTTDEEKSAYFKTLSEKAMKVRLAKGQITKIRG